MESILKLFSDFNYTYAYIVLPGQMKALHCRFLGLIKTNLSDSIHLKKVWFAYIGMFTGKLRELIFSLKALLSPPGKFVHNETFKA